MVNIKQATVADAALIVETGSMSFIESHGNSAPGEDIASYVSAKFTLSVLENELADPKNIFHIIYFNDEAAGYSKIILNEPYALIKESPVTKMERLYLLKKFYDQKLGMKLFDFILKLSKQEKQLGIWLYVWTANERAVRFYKNAGFEVIDETYFKISATHSNPNHIMYLKYQVVLFSKTGQPNAGVY
ncbi:GNAT family N-acetyltransferase [soil metagenome]